MNKAFRHIFWGGQKMKKSLGYNLPLKPHCFFHDISRYTIHVSNICTLFFPFSEHCAPNIKTVFHHNFRMTKKDVLPCNIDLQKRRKENMNYKPNVKSEFTCIWSGASNTIRVEWKLNCCFELFMEWCWIMFGVDKI